MDPADRTLGVELIEMRDVRLFSSYGIVHRPMMKRISMAALGLLAFAACGDGTLSNGGGGEEPNGGDGMMGGGNGGTGGGAQTDPRDVAGSNPNTRVVRLSHAQY